jgi:hypothetical protein
MQKRDFFPAFKRYFYSSCLVTKKLPPVGYGNLKAACKDRKQPVHESWADMITYLACCLSTKVGEVEPEPPIRDTQCREYIKNWIQRLSTAVMALWSQDAISADVALTAKIPVFPYGECLLKCTAEHVLMMQPMAMVKPRNWDTDDGEIEVNDSNNNAQDPQPSSFSESSISAHPASTMDNAMDIEEQLDFEPPNRHDRQNCGSKSFTKRSTKSSSRESSSSTTSKSRRDQDGHSSSRSHHSSH